MVISVRSFGAQNCQVESADALDCRVNVSRPRYEVTESNTSVRWFGRSFSFKRKVEMAGHLLVMY